MKIIESIFNVGEITDTTLAEIVEKLRSQEMLDAVMRVRNAGDNGARKLAKLRLPAFTLCRVTDRVDTDHFIDTEYLIFDCDGLKGSVATQRAIEKVRPFALFAFISPSGRGIKFVIQMDRPIPAGAYRANVKHYRELLAAETGLDLDRNYNALHTFFGHYADCEINPAPRIFPALMLEAVALKADVCIDTLDGAELKHVCEYLSKQKLSFTEWTAVGFALHAVPAGRELFLLIGAGDTDEDHAHRNWDSKWKQCDSGRGDVTLASLFWVAHNHGYKRQNIFAESGRGHYNPFLVNKDGLYVKQKEGRPLRLFGFRAISQVYYVHDPAGSRVCLRIDGKELIAKTTIFSSALEFRKALQGAMSVYMITNGKAVCHYDELFNYIDATKEDLIVRALPGAGAVSDDVWNFGSIVMMDGKAMPYDPLIISDKRGFMLDDVRDMIYVRDTPRLGQKMNIFAETYGNVAATALGWAVANLYYRRILPEIGGFPILFLYGPSSSGKSKLANIILSMFGVRNAETSMFRILLSSGATATSMNRVKDLSRGIPHFFDEYGTARDNKSRETHFQVLKGLYDGVGKTMARKTNDNQVWRLDVSSGTIFASVDKDNREEAINRCVYIDMAGVKDRNADALRFQAEFMSPRGLEEFSALALHVVYETSWQGFVAAYRDYVDVISASGADSRVVNNWAICAAGYSLLAKVFKKPVPDNWWIKMARDTSGFAEEANPVNQFLAYVHKFAMQKKFPEILQCYEDGDGWELIFHLPSMLIEVRKEERLVDGLIHLSARELSSQLRKHPYYEKESVMRLDGTQMRVFHIQYREESDDV